MQVDRRALLAAELKDDDMVNGYADAWFGCSYQPPNSLNGVPSRYNQYARGYERAIQQLANGVEWEYKARTGKGLCSICLNTYEDHRWGKQKAQNDGWFFSKAGPAYCPDHVPHWVADWRAKAEIRSNLYGR